MRKIFLFNPDNDLAMAHGGEHYIAPPFARKMQSDLAALPIWYAPEGAEVLVEDESTKEWANNMSQTFNLQVTAITKHDLPSESNATFHPWGWSGTIKRRLMKMRVNPQALPADSYLKELRMLAHRRITIAFHDRLKESLPNCCFLPPTPSELHNFHDVRDFAIANKGCYVKSPWSGSGQGVYHVTEPESKEFEQWCQGVIKRQGSLLCEVGFDRTLDFALEFYCKNGSIQFLGYSVFQSDAHSQYGAGIVNCREALRKMILDQCPSFAVIEAAVAKTAEETIAPFYEDGYFGIDMLLYRGHGEVLVNPCVEVNLRATMGLVTSQIGERLGMRGHYKVAYSKNGFLGEKPENRVYLTPITAETQYCAYIDVL